MTARLPAVALVLLVVLSACAGDADPTTSPSRGGAASPSSDAPLQPSGSGQPAPSLDPSVPPSPGSSAQPEPTPDPRVESALAQLDTDEALIGQLLMIGWPGRSSDGAREPIETLRPGAIVYVLANADTAERATAINVGLDGVAHGAGILPLLKAIDHEGGGIQRIGDVENLGSNLAFAEGRPSDHDACQRGAVHARQLRTMGFDMNLAPVLDVNTNPDNPVIGARSFGSRPQLVARLGSAYIRGLQSGGIVAVGKHFPGHGDTSVNSHLGLPVLEVGRRRLDTVELVPFERAIAPDTGLAAVMTAHVALPRIDPSGLPATISQPIIGGILRDDLGFDGLVLTDDLGPGMAAVTDAVPPGDAAVASLKAGVDMLMVIGDRERQTIMRDALLAALTSGELPRERVIDAVRHILTAKARAGLLGGEPAVVPGC